jgi:hypothetical protein
MFLGCFADKAGLVPEVWLFLKKQRTSFKIGVPRPTKEDAAQ